MLLLDPEFDVLSEVEVDPEFDAAPELEPEEASEDAEAEEEAALSDFAAPAAAGSLTPSPVAASERESVR